MPRRGLVGNRSCASAWLLDAWFFVMVLETGHGRWRLQNVERTGWFAVPADTKTVGPNGA